MINCRGYLFEYIQYSLKKHCDNLEWHLSKTTQTKPLATQTDDERYAVVSLE